MNLRPLGPETRLIPSRKLGEVGLCFQFSTELPSFQITANNDNPKRLAAVYSASGVLTSSGQLITRTAYLASKRRPTSAPRGYPANLRGEVPVSAALFSYLQAYTAPQNNPWLFPSPEGCSWNPDNFSHRLADLNRKAGLEWSCAEYQHTFGTQLAMAGRDERTIAELMGNSPEIVRRYYAAWLPNAHPEAVEFDTPGEPVPMAQPVVANLRVEAERRGLRVVRAE